MCTAITFPRPQPAPPMEATKDRNPKGKTGDGVGREAMEFITITAAWRMVASMLNEKVMGSGDKNRPNPTAIS